MRNVARATLAVVLLLGGLTLLPRPASRVVAPEALAQLPIETPTLPDPDDILNEPAPDPVPEPPTDDTTGGTTGGDGVTDGGSGSTGGDGGSSTGGGTTGGDTTGSVSGPASSDGNAASGSSASGEPTKRVRKDREPETITSPAVSAYRGSYRIFGTFDTDKLVKRAQRLRSLGISGRELLRKAYSPFIIGGPAGWTDTWGAPRYGPAPGQIRAHEGQDVFCRYGDPVLASEAGVVEFDNRGLGGLVARLHRSDGSYWYYAHLSGFNKRLSSGDTVATGDVIGYCGNTGNAITTPPHVHFGWYKANGQARNPMKALVTWLHEAERRAGVALTRGQHERIRIIEDITVARRFGEAFMPDLSMIGPIRVVRPALIEAQSPLPPGPFNLTEFALQVAMIDSLGEDVVRPDGAVAARGPTQTSRSTLEKKLRAVLDTTRRISRTEAGD